MKTVRRDIEMNPILGSCIVNLRPQHLHKATVAYLLKEISGNEKASERYMRQESVRKDMVEVGSRSFKLLTKRK